MEIEFITSAFDGCTDERDRNAGSKLAQCGTRSYVLDLTQRYSARESRLLSWPKVPVPVAWHLCPFSGMLIRAIRSCRHFPAKNMGPIRVQ